MAKIAKRVPYYDVVTPEAPKMQEYIDPKLFPGFEADDAGKTLVVNENGEWCCQEGGSTPGGSSGPVSWNDLTDKPFYDANFTEYIEWSEVDKTSYVQELGEENIDTGEWVEGKKWYKVADFCDLNGFMQMSFSIEGNWLKPYNLYNDGAYSGTADATFEVYNHYIDMRCFAKGNSHQRFAEEVPAGIYIRENDQFFKENPDCEFRFSLEKVAMDSGFIPETIRRIEEFGVFRIDSSSLNLSGATYKEICDAINYGTLAICMVKFNNYTVLANKLEIASGVVKVYAEDKVYNIDSDGEVTLS